MELLILLPERLGIAQNERVVNAFVSLGRRPVRIDEEGASIDAGDVRDLDLAGRLPLPGIAVLGLTVSDTQRTGGSNGVGTEVGALRIRGAQAPGSIHTAVMDD